jgi:hypothetical protein
MDNWYYGTLPILLAPGAFIVETTAPGDTG